MRKFLFIALVGAVLTSCSVTKTSTAKSLDITGAGVMHLPVVADLDVSDVKKSHTITLSKVENMAAARNTAISELLEKESGDVLVEPKFITETRGSKTELTVTGWPAKYRNFRKMTLDDLKLIEVQPHLYKANTAQPAVEKKKKFRIF